MKPPGIGEDPIYTQASFPDTALFGVYSPKGEFLYKFGELVRLYTTEPDRRGLFGMLNSFYNEYRFCIDSNGYLYCAFTEEPVMRKYSPKGELLLEADYFAINGIEQRHKDWIEENKDIISGKNRGYSPKMFVRNIRADDDYLYVSFNNIEDPLYVFDKETFAVVRRIEFSGSGGRWRNLSLTAASPDHFYVVQRRLIGKFKKQEE